MMRHVLITGGAGFIGSHLCESFLARGYAVTAVDNLVTGRVQNLSEARKNPNFSYVTGTGANDIINIVKNGPNQATVTVKAFDDVARTVSIPVPKFGGSSYSYSIPLDKPIMLIGRHQECDIQIPSRKISRRHCCIALISDHLVIRDLAQAGILGSAAGENQVERRDDAKRDGGDPERAVPGGLREKDLVGGAPRR